MKVFNKFVATYVPNMLTVVLLLMLLVLSLDVFDIDASFGEKMLGLLIHNIPTFIGLIFFLLALKKAWLGGVFIPIGIFYQVVFYLNAGSDALLSGLPVAIMLYLVGSSWIFRYFYIKKEALNQD